MCLGAVIRGETAHFDLVANEAARGIADVARDADIPVIFEVLAVENLAQAEDRARWRARQQGVGGGRGRPVDGRRCWRSSRRRDRRSGRRQGGRHVVIVDKPWGKVATYALNQPSSVRMITVEPAQETSVHYHRMRDEMWVVLDPGLTIEIGNRVVEAQAGEEFMVAAEETHRIRNVGHGPRPRAGDRVRLHHRGRHPAPRGRVRTPARGGLVSVRRHPGRATPILAGQQGRTCASTAPARPVLVLRKR